MRRDFDISSIHRTKETLLSYILSRENVIFSGAFIFVSLLNRVLPIWTPRAGARSSQTQSERPDSDGPPIVIKKDLRPSTSTPSTCALRERRHSQSYVRGIARSRAHRVFLGFRIRTCAQWPVPPAAVPRLSVTSPAYSTLPSPARLCRPQNSPIENAQYH